MELTNSWLTLSDCSIAGAANKKCQDGRWPLLVLSLTSTVAKVIDPEYDWAPSTLIPRRSCMISVCCNADKATPFSHLPTNIHFNFSWNRANDSNNV
ncbi:hypothetical protein T10_4675 [Trichinella papuae]|uniref:Uncharacterized protein n=1 Tax=Trichinella papuae TaxID=268474 RepID=A0A0V1M559_9BILA|nr:hypothetical protein T10_6011 [Trichinella papuae]KRZ66693.1 hypothetical protein T10_4675 [Trichinella papuae]